jgi:hypothetical protein
VAVRLCDVAPDGASSLVSWGLLNLTHRDSHEFPVLLEPGRRFVVTVQLNVCGHRIAAGHRWRVSLTPTYVRHAWPSPVPVTLRLFGGQNSRLSLPVRRPSPVDAHLPEFLPPEVAPPIAREQLRTGKNQKTLTHDLIGGYTELCIEYDEGRLRYTSSGMEVDDYVREVYRIKDGDPLSLVVAISRKLELQRGTWRIRIETTSKMTADMTHFHVSNQLDAYEGDARVFTTASTKAIPRAFV